MIDDRRRQQIEQFVQSLSEDELRLLYRELGAQIRSANRAREQYALRGYRVLDRVVFHTTGGRHIEGTVTRINQRTVSVLTTGGEKWTVSPQYLRKLESGVVEGEVVEDAPRDDVIITVTSSPQKSTSAGSGGKSKQSRHKQKNKHKKK